MCLFVKVRAAARGRLQFQLTPWEAAAARTRITATPQLLGGDNGRLGENAVRRERN